jgi:hypothetical protein
MNTPDNFSAIDIRHYQINLNQVIRKGTHLFKRFRAIGRLINSSVDKDSLQGCTKDQAIHGVVIHHQ